MKYKYLSYLKLIVGILITYWLFKNQQLSIRNISTGLSNFKLALEFILLCTVQLILASFRTQILIKNEHTNWTNLRSTLHISWASTFINNISPIPFIGEIFRINHLVMTYSASKDSAVYASIFSKIFSTFSLIFISVTASLILNFFLEVKMIPRTQLIFKFIFIFSIISILLNIQIKKFLLKPCYTQVLKLAKSKYFKERLSAGKDYLLHLISKKITFIKILVLSILIQLFNILSYMLIINELNPTLRATQSLKNLILVPVGIFFSSLPISFSGLGIGHMAFHQILSVNQIQNGADVFSIYFAFSYLFNLLGIYSFIKLFYKHKLITSKATS